MTRRLLFIVYDFSRNMRKKNIGAFAASTAFFLFLSLIPALMLLCAVLPYTPLTEANLMQVATEIAPDTMDPLIVGMIADVYDKSIGIISITAIVTLWSAGKGILALMRGLNAVNDVEEDRNYLLLRIVASLYTVLILVLIIVSLLILVFGSFLLGAVESVVPRGNYLISFLMHFRTPMVWALSTVAIASLYTYVPGRKNRFRMQIPGAAFAAIGWSVTTWGFSMYVEEFNGLTIYGNLTTIIVLMLWLYACMYVVLSGAYLNRYFKPAFQFLLNKSDNRRKPGADQKKHIDKRKKID